MAWGSDTALNATTVCANNISGTSIASAISNGDVWVTSDTLTIKEDVDNLIATIKEMNKKPDVDPEVKSTLTKNSKGKLCAAFYKDGFKTSTKELIPDIKDVIVYNDHVVVVEFVDGTSEKAVLHPEDQFSIEQGISICITKKLVGGSSIYNKLIDRAIKVKINNDAEKTKREQEEEARKERKKKNDEKKARRKAAKREEYIETQKEAYIRALREVGIGD